MMGESVQSLHVVPRSERKRRVVHLIPQDAVGGVEIAARSMAERDELLCDFTLMLIAGRSLMSNKRNVRESRFRSINNPIAHLAMLLELIKSAPDVLVCSLWRTAPVGLLFKLLRPRTRLIVFLHSSTPLHLVDYVFNACLARASDAIWADSTTTLHARAHYRRPRPVRVISLVTEKLRPIQQTAPGLRFVCWSALARRKGIDRALRLVKLLADTRPETSFEIWGPDNGERLYLQRLTRDLGIEKYVHFMGVATAKQLPGIAARHCFYLQLSRIEGMAMSVVEAMQFGLIPVITAVGEMQRYCTNGQTALVCDPSRLEDAAKQILALVDDHAKYRRIRCNASKYWKSAALYADDFCAALSDI